MRRAREVGGADCDHFADFFPEASGEVMNNDIYSSVDDEANSPTPTDCDYHTDITSYEDWLKMQAREEL
ncbi:hypothetical protein PRIPAC_85741 [Pristionchus pacificus]|uniref:Uncharacterized protein n=1 Tax=Pristionchus pacificus TaxID=54126 RepID=A0A454XKB6_PRIPA|nr:hypothetical protein PRIPAC_85741 [Pristionchus pacificus]|eukprot:PDM67183.1 hypothetical protein PRIPAC_48600 [Pristionchus pacificus]